MSRLDTEPTEEEEEEVEKVRRRSMFILPTNLLPPGTIRPFCGGWVVGSITGLIQRVTWWVGAWGSGWEARERESKVLQLRSLFVMALDCFLSTCVSWFELFFFFLLFFLRTSRVDFAVATTRESLPTRTCLSGAA